MVVLKGEPFKNILTQRSLGATGLGGEPGVARLPDELPLLPQDEVLQGVTELRGFAGRTGACRSIGAWGQGGLSRQPEFYPTHPGKASAHPGRERGHHVGLPALRDAQHFRACSWPPRWGGKSGPGPAEPHGPGQRRTPEEGRSERPQRQGGRAADGSLYLRE